MSDEAAHIYANLRADEVAIDIASSKTQALKHALLTYFYECKKQHEEIEENLAAVIRDAVKNVPPKEFENEKLSKRMEKILGMLLQKQVVRNVVDLQKLGKIVDKAEQEHCEKHLERNMQNLLKYKKKHPELVGLFLQRKDSGQGNSGLSLEEERDIRNDKKHWFRSSWEKEMQKHYSSQKQTVDSSTNTEQEGAAAAEAGPASATTVGEEEDYECQQDAISGDDEDNDGYMSMYESSATHSEGKAVLPEQVEVFEDPVNVEIPDDNRQSLRSNISEISIRKCAHAQTTRPSRP